MAAEHQQTRISAIGLATELSELRDALAKAGASKVKRKVPKPPVALQESQSYQESTTSVQRWVTETMALRQSLEEEAKPVGVVPVFLQRAGSVSRVRNWPMRL